MPAGVISTWDIGGSEADGGVHDVSAVAGLVAHEAASVKTAGVAGDSGGTHHGVNAKGEVGKSGKEAIWTFAYGYCDLEKQNQAWKYCLLKLLVSYQKILDRCFCRNY